ncbi:MAG TPA: SDR family oxidoreductase [Clostridiaceae bacterium]|nr:SDR family oxidoreductase [Clostridiaceae bacterium]
MNAIIDLSNKRILIIGASSGIGKQTAITLSQVGSKLTLVARNEEKLKMVLDDLEGEGHDYFVADVSDVAVIESMIKEIVEKDGPLDGLVYSAGVGMAIPFMQSKPEKVQSTFNVNFFGFFEVVRQISRKGRFNPGMRIVGVSSCASLRGDKSKAIYSSSKAAMDSAVRCMAKELAEKEICINTVAPSMTATELYNYYIEKYGKDSKTNKELLTRQYLGIAQPQDIANAIAFLISPAARFITGITMPVDGGLTTC